VATSIKLVIHRLVSLTMAVAAPVTQWRPLVSADSVKGLQQAVSTQLDSTNKKTYRSGVMLAGCSQLAWPVALATAGALCRSRHIAKHGCTRQSAAKTLRCAAADAEQTEQAPAPDDAQEELEMPKMPPPFDPSVQVGAMAPLGYFDPLGLCPPGDVAKFQELRAAELKHGRVAMLASIGAVAQHFIRFPGFNEVPAGLGAAQKVPGSMGFWFLVFLTAPVEVLFWRQEPNTEPGNFGDPLGLGMYDDEMRNRELNNGRFAMFATLGIIAAELYTGKDAVQQLGF